VHLLKYSFPVNLVRKDRNDFVFDAMVRFPVILVCKDRNGEWERIVNQIGVVSPDRYYMAKTYS
jgi:hypothetical protein